MGRVRTKTIKKAGRHLVLSYFQRLTNDYELNKRIVDEIAEIQTKRLRNKISGFATCLVKRMLNSTNNDFKIQGSFKDRFSTMSQPSKYSIIKAENVEVDEVTLLMVKSLNVYK